MIRALRRRHRWMWTVLALALPALLALALLSRPDDPAILGEPAPSVVSPGEGVS